jgi:phosphosulfolactate synthase
VDVVKLGFGTSAVTNNLKEKIAIYAGQNIPVYFGGTLFEAFLVRNQFEDYIAVLKGSWHKACRGIRRIDYDTPY